MKLWTRGGKVIRDAFGRVIQCDDCPCPADTGTGTGTSVPFEGVSISECLCDGEADFTGTSASTPPGFGGDRPCPESDYGGEVSTILLAHYDSFSSDIITDCSQFTIGETYQLTYQGICCIGTDSLFTAHFWLSEPLHTGTIEEPCSFLAFYLTCNRGFNAGYDATLAIVGAASNTAYCNLLTSGAIPQPNTCAVVIGGYTICRPFDMMFPCNSPCTILGPPGDFGPLTLSGPGDGGVGRTDCGTFYTSPNFATWTWTITD